MKMGLRPPVCNSFFFRWIFFRLFHLKLYFILLFWLFFRVGGFAFPGPNLMFFFGNDERQVQTT